MDQGAWPPAPETETSTSSIRRRELYKYIPPPDGNPANATIVSRLSTPDSILVAHLQLASWRLDCPRAMLSLIDKEDQFFIAESTKTLDIFDSTSYAGTNDGLWLDAGCTSVPKQGRLCEQTIAQAPPAEGGPAHFEICDLDRDERFRNLPFVSGPPYFRYYCGVPLRTKRGVSIGSVFVMDVKVRKPAGQVNLEVLDAIATNCMAHLDMLREKRARVRAFRMNQCLAAFVDPDYQGSKHVRGHSSAKVSTGHPRTPSGGSGNQTAGEDHQHTPRHGPNLSPPAASIKCRHVDRPRSDQDASSSSNSDSGSASWRGEEKDSISTLQRAANLMHTSLSLESGGGVVFMAPTQAYKQGETHDDTTGDEPPQSLKLGSHSGSPSSGIARSSSSWKVHAQRRSINDDVDARERADVLAYSINLQGMRLDDDDFDSEPFTALTTSQIARLVKRYPRGKLFTFEGDGLLSSSSEDEGQGNPCIPVELRAGGAKASFKDAQLLRKHFPHARQLIFIPVWDSASSRWCSCFAFSSSEFRNFKITVDFLHCVAFTNCVSAEIARIATLAADQQKSDFIGSISHELRTPLHGILASCEFLASTECSSFQKSLVDTADSCGRTLLDTLNMVLDYTKINHFERNLNKARKSGTDSSMGAVAGQMPGLAPLLNIYGDVDLAVITEEGVEGVASGQMFRDSINSVDTADFRSGTSPVNSRGEDDKIKSLRKANVEVILDIAARDWTFVTQPGAFRRIIMNLFGNSLKYTKSGFIRVHLEAREAPMTPDVDGAKLQTAASIMLTITDSGSGMSPHYMQTKLFTPFSQESSLNPGTGLGLSLVKSIVTMLNGSINIQSALGVGTEVRVVLPMAKSSSDGLTSSTPSSGSIERAKDESLAFIKRESEGKTVSMFRRPTGSSDTTQDQAAHMLSSSAMLYLQEWFKFKITEWTPRAMADIVLVHEYNLLDLEAEHCSLFSRDSKSVVLVLCSTALRHVAKDNVSRFEIAESLSLPFGPYKFAKALRICLSRLSPDLASIGVTKTDEQTVSGADTSSRSVEEVTQANPHVMMSGDQTGGVSIPVLQQGSSVLAHRNNPKAQKALGDLSSMGSSDGRGLSRESFPFPGPVDAGEDHTVLPSSLPIPKDRPALIERRTMATTRKEMDTLEPKTTIAPTSKRGAITTDSFLSTTSTPPAQQTRAPRLLLVDDNPINLRLLETMMKKRSYKNITLAKDGVRAVAAFTAAASRDPPEPPDIIFMDITMPLMNGFEATRRIRSIEAEYRARSDLSPTNMPATSLIVALTGLASGRDQSEAFTSGVDLYLTKPVSMKDVGRLLTNWESNMGAASIGVPKEAVLLGG